MRRRSNAEKTTDDGSRAPAAGRSVVVDALIFAGGTLLSRILGLLRDVLIARHFPNDMRDAFVNAFRLPNLFRRVFGEGSLSVGFIPVFIEVLGGRAAVSGREKTQAEQRAHELVSGIFTILLGLTLTVTTLAIVFMEDILRLLLGGHAYMSVPGKFELTVALARIMFAFFVVIATYGFFMAVLNSLGRFVASAIAPCFFNVAVIAVAFFSRQFSTPVHWLALAVLVGGTLQMLALVPSLMRSGFFPRLRFKAATPEVWKVLRNVVPSIFGVGILQITALVNMRFAAELESGSHSYLYLADRILELPLSLFVVSIGSALLPALSHSWASGDREGMSATINHYVRLIVFVALPAAIGMFALAAPIAEVLFLGREFKYDSVLATAGVIRIYSLSVIAIAGVRILAQGFYAIQNTWFPAVAAGVALVAHVIFAYVFTRAFQLEGLAAASVASAFVNMLMLATAYNAWIGSLHVRGLAKSLAKFVACGLVLIAVLQGHEYLAKALSGKVPRAKAIALFTTIAVGIIAYFGAAHVLKIEEYRETVAAFRAKLASRRRAALRTSGDA